MVGDQLRRSRDRAVLADDGVALRVPGAGGVAGDDRAIALLGIAARDRAGDQIRARAVAVHDDQTRALSCAPSVSSRSWMCSLALAASVARVTRVVLSTPPICEVSMIITESGREHLGDRVDAADAPALPVPTCCSRYFTRAPFSRKKRWMPLWRAGSPVSVWTPAGHDRHVRVLADVEVVVGQIVHAAVRDARGDGHRFALRARQDADVQPGLILFGFDFDVLGRAPAGAATVFADVERAVELARPVRHHLEQSIQNLIHPANASLLPQQDGILASAINSGMTSLTAPTRLSVPPAITAIWSAICKIRSWR